jgi:hypothetical protein
MKRTTRKAGSISLLILAGISCFGCAKPAANRASAANTGNLYVVATKSASFNHFSPHQEVGPDKILQRDTVVTLIRPSFGYSKVRLMSGEEGYVASKDLRVAPATLVATTTEPPPPASGPTLKTDTTKPTPPAVPPPSPEFEPSPLPSPPLDQ